MSIEGRERELTFSLIYQRFNYSYYMSLCKHESEWTFKPSRERWGVTSRFNTQFNIVTTENAKFYQILLLPDDRLSNEWMIITPRERW